MNWLKKDCETYREMISALLDDELSAGDKARLRAHLAHCDDCCALCVAFAAAGGALGRTMEDIPVTLHRKTMAAVREQARGQWLRQLRRYMKPALITAACLVVIAAAVFAMQPAFTRQGGDESSSSMAAVPETMAAGASEETAEETADAGAEDAPIPAPEEAAEKEAEEPMMALYADTPSVDDAVNAAEAPASGSSDPAGENGQVLMSLELEVTSAGETDGGSFTAVVLNDSGGLLSPGVRVTVESPAAAETEAVLQPGDRVMVLYDGLRAIPEGWLVVADSVETIE